MLLSPSPVSTRIRRFTSGLSPAVARRRREALKTETIEASGYTRKRHIRTGSRVKYPTHQRKTNTLRVGWEWDERKDRRRPDSDPPAVTTGQGRRNTPRLTRQGAFHWLPSDTDNAELYRLGILYEEANGNERICGSDCHFNAIIHSEPEHSVRQTKRAKRTHSYQFPLKEEDIHLSIELISAYLGNDTVIARFFTSANDEQCAGLYHDDLDRFDSRHTDWAITGCPPNSLAIIYELDESSAHSPESIPGASDFPDLVSDTEDER
ncbi:hypothetical protein F4861DRAFT_226269 [Xylaria intraflava]|nr:hypothetical protein F4861DRAFT_226269 [Xylaria intraflava]